MSLDRYEGGNLIVLIVLVVGCCVISLIIPHIFGKAMQTRSDSKVYRFKHVKHKAL